MEPEEEYELLNEEGYAQAGVIGPASEARREIMHYYNMYKDDGVRIYQVFRKYEEVQPGDLQ